MPKYLVQASYNAEGVKGLAADGATARKAAVAKAAESLGGKLEAFYFAFGESDVFSILDLPDNGAAARFAIKVAATGQVRVKTTALLSTEEIDRAIDKKIDYRAPGEKK
ncbi:MAG TPA: GYD domain-containing protein [Stellaceae bacterium]|jgi:uncharacterized protein with GYD domain